MTKNSNLNVKKALKKNTKTVQKVEKIAKN